MGQQLVGQTQKQGGQGSLGSTWSDPSVNISLDFLSAGLNPTKSPPTLNNIIQQQGSTSAKTSTRSFPPACVPVIVFVLRVVVRAADRR